MIFLGGSFQTFWVQLILRGLIEKKKQKKARVTLRRAGAYIFAVLGYAIPFDDPKVA